MSFITDFFSALGEIISSIIDFIVDFFTGLIDFFSMIPEYIDVVFQYLDMIPPEFLVWGSLFLSVSLIFVIIGRRGK